MGDECFGRIGRGVECFLYADGGVVGVKSRAEHVRKPKNRGQNNGAVTGFGGGIVHSPNLVQDQNDPVSVDRCAVCARMTHVECDQIESGVIWKS
jgi:hypothetical protein